MTSAEIKEYLGIVYKLEASKYKQQLLIDNLIAQKERVKNPKLIGKKEVNDSKKSIILGGMAGIIISPIIGAIAGFAVGFVLLLVMWLASILGHILGFLFGKNGFFNFLIGLNDADWGEMLMPICAVLVFFIGIVVAILGIREESRSRKAARAYNIKADERNKGLAANARARVANLERQINKAKVSYAQTEARLKKAYGMNIIHPKYHGIGPISRFYEYFDTGMCSTLEGHEGAYVLYENEIRLNRIIEGIDEVKTLVEAQSEQMKKNQYMIYQAVREGIDASNRVSNAIAECNNRLANIESNTEVTRYYSGITAINTTFDTWYNRH